MRYTLKDFYSVDSMFFFPNINEGIWVDEDEAKQRSEEHTSELQSH